MSPHQPPYYAVIFRSQRTNVDAGYGETADLMEQLAAEQPGYLGIESIRDANGRGLTISYWSDRVAIANWKSHAMHLVAQRRGRSEWYTSFSLEICLVEEARTWSKENGDA